MASDMLKLLRVLAEMDDSSGSDSDDEGEKKVKHKYIDESFPPEFSPGHKSEIDDVHDINKLCDLYDVYSTGTPLKCGDCVAVKEDIRKIVNYPGEKSFGIITRILSKPVYSKKGKEEGSTIEHEPLTVAVLFFVNDSNESRGVIEIYFNEARLKLVSRDDCDDPVLYDRLCAKRDEFLAVDKPFAPGDIVMWKPGFQNKLRPEDNGVGVVMEVISEPHFNYTEQVPSSDLLFHEPLDLIIGTLSTNGDLVTFSYDSRRFMHAPKEIVDELNRNNNN